MGFSTWNSIADRTCCGALNLVRSTVPPHGGRLAIALFIAKPASPPACCISPSCSSILALWSLQGSMDGGIFSEYQGSKGFGGAAGNPNSSVNTIPASPATITATPSLLTLLPSCLLALRRQDLRTHVTRCK